MTIQVKIYGKKNSSSKQKKKQTTTNSKALILVPIQSQIRYDCLANSLGFCLCYFRFILFTRQYLTECWAEREGTE